MGAGGSQPPSDGLSRGSGFVQRRAQVDAVYEAFVQKLPRSNREIAERLSDVLGLAPAGVAWSRVFAHEITFAAPSLVASGMPSLHASVVREAVLAHMLLVLEGMLREGLATGGVERSAGIERLLAQMSTARDQAASFMTVAVCAHESHFDLALNRFEQAIAVEQSVLEPLEPLDFGLYDRIVSAKQALLLPAPDALALRAGWSDARRHRLRQVLTLAGSAMRMYQDVVGWEEAQMRGGSWTLVLARRRASVGSAGVSQPVPASTRVEVLESGVLPDLLQRALRNLVAAAKLARRAGLPELDEWAKAHALSFEELHRAELRYPGYAARAKELRGWAETILT